MMKLAAFAALAAAALTLPGCFLGCSAYNGGSDQQFTRDADTLMLCENGGFVIVQSTGTIEGRIVDIDGAETGVEGDNAATVFTLEGDLAEPTTIATSGTVAGTWTYDALDQTALDHADVQCTDLTTRAWWGSAQ